MPNTYVAVDVETTGLDPVRDSIIEIAAITYVGHDVVEEFVTLVDPQREIPGFISSLTGITDEMVVGMPTISQLRSRLRTTLADNIIVGHNVDFDMGFLRAAMVGQGNHRIDTLALAPILIPEAGRYGLEPLARFLSLPGGDSWHRAGNDAIQTIELFLALRERAAALTLAQLEEIVQAGRKIGWPETLFFEEVLAEESRHAFERNELRQRGQLKRLYNAPKLEGHTPEPVEPPTMLDIELLTDLIMPDGHFSRYFPGFEYRPQQVEMMQSVAQAFNTGQHIMVEAGTGTGKSLGYLLPAAFWSTQNGRRVVVSTNTINLQDQLVGKDVPALQEMLSMDLRAAVRKGRSNYLCTRLFQQMRHTGPTNADEMALYARLLLWLPTTVHADVSELSLRTPGQRMAWTRLNGENPTCTADKCAAENCPLHVARRRAELAHIVVVNHALLLADMSSGNLILPEFLDLIIDEAHHLESAVTDGMSFRADKRFLTTVLEEASRARAGMVGIAQQRIAEAAPVDASREVDQLADKVRNNAQAAEQELEDFFATLGFFLESLRSGNNKFADQIRLTESVRIQPEYNLVELSWENLSRLFGAVSKGFSQLAEAVETIAVQHDVEGEDELRAALMTSAQALDEARMNIDGMIFNPDSETIYWAEIWRDNVSLHAAPLDIGPLVREHIFESKEAVVLTSATMRTAGYGGSEPSFEYMRQRIDADHADELAVGSPFDYKQSTLLYLATDMPEPNQPGYQRFLEQAIVDTAMTMGGRTMALFTANGHLAQTAQSIEGRLAPHGITVLAQNQGMSRQQLVEQFRQEGARAVLLGTRSFWEGVDIPGPALEALIIAKLPFDVPSDPIFAARSEGFDNPFFEYSVPEAILRFRQGFGRLIRRTTDEGVVLVLDKRVLTKRYGELFLEALPECTVVRQRTDRIGEILQRWIDRDRSVRL